MRACSKLKPLSIAICILAFCATAGNAQEVRQGTLLYCVGGLDDDDNFNMQVLRDKLENEYAKKGATIGYCEWNQAEKAVREINSHIEKNGKTPVILLGHSFGGDTAVHEIAPKLKHPICLLYTSPSPRD